MIANYLTRDADGYYLWEEMPSYNETDGFWHKHLPAIRISESEVPETWIPYFKSDFIIKIRPTEVVRDDDGVYDIGEIHGLYLIDPLKPEYP